MSSRTGSGYSRGPCTVSDIVGCAVAPRAVVQVGSAYLDLGLQPKDRVGVFGANCPEWMLAMQGCNRTRYQGWPVLCRTVRYSLYNSSLIAQVQSGAGLHCSCKSPEPSGPVQQLQLMAVLSSSLLTGLLSYVCAVVTAALSVCRCTTHWEKTR